MTIEFGLLGPVTLRIDGDHVALPGGRPRLLLAALLLGRGRRVSADRLLSGLWADPPPSAQANLRTYVTRLRTALGPYRDRLTWVNSGYMVVVEPGELDLHRFEADLKDALGAGRATHPEQCADLLATALRRWYGEAAEGLPRHGALGHSLDALDESRWMAVERYARACVDAGRHQAAVAALRSLLADQPARESAWEGLVQALIRSGDRAEAMAALTAADAALLGEVGRRAGQVLREIERELLDAASGPARRPLPGVGDASSAGAPSTLPPSVVLVGRECLLAQVEAQLSRADMMVLHGPAGVGKSALAGAIATRLAPSCPGGQLYLDLCGSSPGLAPMTVEEAIGSLLRALGGDLSGGTSGAEAAELRVRAGERRVLVVLDNVVDAGQVRRLLSILSNATVIVTSRTTLPTLDVTHLAIGELGPDDSVTLLARHAGPDRFTESPPEAEALAALCGHLPLALRIVGARLASHPEWTLAAMVARLSDEQYRLDELSCDDLAVRASLAVTCDVLAERPGGLESLDLFDRWGMICSPVLGLDLARVLTGATARAARAALDRLADAGLVEACGMDRYRLHDLVRIFAMERGRRDPAARVAALHAARCYFLDTARRARDQIRPVPHRLPDGFVEAPATVTFAHQREALEWLETERDNLVAAARVAAQDGTPEGDLFAVRLCAELYPFLPMRGYYRELREVAGGALRCARRLGSRPDEAASLTYVAVAQSRLGETGQAVDGLLVALALREADGDNYEVAVTLDHLGVLLAAAGRLDEARAGFLRALEMHRRGGDRRRVGLTLNNLADVLLQLGQTGSALVHLRESLRLRRELGDELGVGITMLTMGQVYARRGECRQAYGWLGKALTAARATGNREAESRVLTVRAEVHRATGQRRAARDDLHLALALSEQIGDANGTREVRRALVLCQLPSGSATAARTVVGR
ncbi:BTAD domain-containing putative transcriptional regulator [Micromonospora sp. NPDC050187]|uniref:AfsR/SARP family transcriptional regulator n=1 Tax=Micromonospora sp. NPDC050187 TaxID=3364277 RepID=UPI00379F511F